MAEGPACEGEGCITCSDEAVPVRVVELLSAGLAVVDTGAGTEEVSVALVDAAVGDVLLVHAREAIAVVSRDLFPPAVGTPAATGTSPPATGRR